MYRYSRGGTERNKTGGKERPCSLTVCCLRLSLLSFPPFVLPVLSPSSPEEEEALRVCFRAVFFCPLVGVVLSHCKLTH